MKKLTFILLLSIFASSVYAVTVYKWVDKEGRVNFTEDYNKIPPIYRDRVEELNISEGAPKMGPSPPSQAPIGQKEGVAKDIYGRDEASWREKVRPWKEQLEQATVNYEATNKRYLERLEELSGKEQLSPTQYKMGITELHGLKEEVKKYEAQIAEANEMLRKLSKEAEETKANPDWLK
jgi:hypothetical protein